MHIASDLTRPSAGESTTRTRIMAHVSEVGPITTSGLVDHLGLTETAVRRHVENLAAEGLIEVHAAAPGPRRRGRPAKSWVLTERGHALLESDYDDLARQTLRFLAEQAGRPAVAEFARRRALDLMGVDAADEQAESGTIQDRAQWLVEALNEQGYAATTRSVGGDLPSPLHGIQLCQGHCPVQHVATEFPEFCDAEAEVFSELLGVHVQRLATLAHGDHVCTTFIPLSTVTADSPTGTSSTKKGSTP